MIGELGSSVALGRLLGYSGVSASDFRGDRDQDCAIRIYMTMEMQDNIPCNEMDGLLKGKKMERPITRHMDTRD